MNDELDSPPFDPTPVEVAEYPVKYTILARSYPETGQTSDNVAQYPPQVQSPDNVHALRGEDYWDKPWPWGPTKANLRFSRQTYENAYHDGIHERLKLVDQIATHQKKIGILEKQVSIWEKTYTTVSELAQQRIQDIATLRHSLNAANEEIERLAMAPQLIASRKAPRKKKAK